MRIPIREQLGILVLLSTLISLAVVSVATVRSPLPLHVETWLIRNRIVADEQAFRVEQSVRALKLCIISAQLTVTAPLASHSRHH